MSGSRRVLPNVTMSPEMASTTKLIPIVQCTMRLTGENRSIVRPVGLPESSIGPRHR